MIGISTSLWVAFALFMASVLALLAVPDIRRLPAAPRPGAGRAALSEMEVR